MWKDFFICDCWEENLENKNRMNPKDSKNQKENWKWPWIAFECGIHHDF